MKNVAFQPLNLHGDHLSGILHCNTDENKRNAKMMQLPLLSALPRGIIKNILRPVMPKFRVKGGTDHDGSTVSKTAERWQNV